MMIGLLRWSLALVPSWGEPSEPPPIMVLLVCISAMSSAFWRCHPHLRAGLLGEYTGNVIIGFKKVSPHEVIGELRIDDNEKQVTADRMNTYVKLSPDVFIPPTLADFE